MHTQQAQLYFNGASRYIGVFEREEHANHAYETMRGILKKSSSKRYVELEKYEIDKQVNLARTKAIQGVSDKFKVVVVDKAKVIA